MELPEKSRIRPNRTYNPKTSMSLPIVAIVGRPNVGKSLLFNWLAGRRISIVDPTAGVTRDRISTVIEIDTRYCELMDTGGIGIQDADNLTAHVEHQIQLAIDSASVVVFLVDVRDGVTPLDQEVSDRLRAIQKPVVLVANKADTGKLGQLAGEFFKLGYGEPIVVSAEQKLGKTELYDAIHAKLPADNGDLPPEEARLKLAIVGRRNVGKSTFINSLAEADRVIVSEVPGTTRDSIDVRFERDGKSFIAIDTAGVQKKRHLPAMSNSTVCTVPNDPSAARMWSCISSIRATGSVAWINNWRNTSWIITSLRYSWSISGTW